MSDIKKFIQLSGRLLLHVQIETVTGLHIGGSETGLEIGGVDKTVIRDSLTNRPYIPGSSLKGKLRSLLEKYNGLEQNRSIGQSKIHTCRTADKYHDCAVCQIFGVPGEEDFSQPTRLVVRDLHMNDSEAERINRRAHTDLPFTEVKTEVAIDRVTAKASPRQMERVPAGTIFGPSTLVYTLYAGTGCDPERDVKGLATLITGFQLLEDDYLGGLGSRGSGRIRFTDFQLMLRPQQNYLATPTGLGDFSTLTALIGELPAIQTQIRQHLALL